MCPYSIDLAMEDGGAWRAGFMEGGLIGSALGAACSVLAVPMAPKSSYLPLIGSQRYCKHNQIVHLLPLALLADDRMVLATRNMQLLAIRALLDRPL